MSTAGAGDSKSDAAARSERASYAARARWYDAGNPVVIRSAATVISRARELPAEVRQMVHEATGDQEDGG
jgi:hypothetical protein